MNPEVIGGNPEEEEESETDDEDDVFEGTIGGV